MAAFAPSFRQTAAVSVCHPVANIVLLTTKFLLNRAKGRQRESGETPGHGPGSFH